MDVAVVALALALLAFTLQAGDWALKRRSLFAIDALPQSSRTGWLRLVNTGQGTAYEVRVDVLWTDRGAVVRRQALSRSGRLDPKAAMDIDVPDSSRRPGQKLDITEVLEFADSLTVAIAYRRRPSSRIVHRQSHTISLFPLLLDDVASCGPVP